ncbi:hypothetical protein EKO23_16335 [Nocardioides guangzhouensis]|uniref:Tyr recombinase domain-containing protein n=1 Tax=Nocardioides guangzhouensis TaxID=2497878 RepID=A0A4Q4Z9H4_9ACTN|nr:hypothetical protein [Nocardioides guangzhouensis]RYP84228.1 hypothetical protein EKO23_16335 [Nocardioides guangzhouensis]
MTSQNQRRKKPNKAAFARALAAAEAEAQASRTLSADLAAVIDNHQPANPTGRRMEKIRPFLHAAIAASSLQGTESVRKHCTHLTELAAYALGRGAALDVATLLTTTFIDEFVRVGMADDGDHLRAERRRRLLALARTANPGPDVPAKLTPIGHSAIKPCYSPAEMAVIRRVSQVQPTQARSRDLTLVVALGAGGGQDSVDMRDLYTDHIEDLGPDGILIHVQGPRPRVVPLRAAYEAMLRQALTDRGPGELLIGTKQDRRNTAARVIERAALHKVAHIEPARLRATWLADLMTDPIPVALILQAAGLKSARTLSELQPHLGPWLEHKQVSVEGVQVLRGEQL